jgi:hypothetical protein
VRITVPRDFVLCPLFAATPQTTSRSVTVGDRRYQIGGFHPLDPAKNPPSLDVRHARALFALLSFRKPFECSAKVEFSMSEFCRRYARSYGGRYAQELRLLLGDLLDTYLRVQQPKSEILRTYRLIERVEIRQGPHPCCSAQSSSNLPSSATWIDSVTLSNELCIALDDLRETHQLNLDSFTTMRSRLAQAIYLYLPSRAHHHTSNQPFEIALTRLLEQVGHPVPPTRKLRKKLFVQNATPVLEQLDQVPVLSGSLRVRLEETATGEDYKLLAWIDRDASPSPSAPHRTGKVAQAFMEGGGSQQELDRRLAHMPSITEYEFSLLERGQIRVEGNERFLRLTKALLGESRFETLLAEAKGDVIEGRPATKNPTARLIHRIMEGLRTPKKESYSVSKPLGQLSTAQRNPWDN